MSRICREFLCWLLAITMLVCPPWGFAQQTTVAAAEPVDQSYITPNTFVAVAAYPRRVLTDPRMEMMPIEVLSAAGKKEMGIDPLDVVSVLMLVEPPQGARGGPPGFGMVMQFAKPYALGSIRLPGNPRLQDSQLEGRPYRQAPSPMTPGLYMPDEQTLIVATDSMLKAMLANKAAPTEGPLRQIVARTGLATDLAAVVVLDPIRPLLTAQLSQTPVPPPFAGVKRLPELIQAAKFELAVTQQPRVALALLAPTEAAAQELEDLVNQLMDTGRQMILAQMAAQMQSDDPVEQAAAQYAERMTRRAFEMFQPERKGKLLTVAQEGEIANQTAVIGVLVALLLPAVQAAREAARRMQSTNNMKQIALAMHIHHDQHKQFPPRAIMSPDGKPLLSWRVAILPYLEQQALYEQFRLDEPWDSEHNKKLLDKMPRFYRNPSAKPSATHASYLVPTGKGAIFAGTDGTPIREIRDGTSNTIMLLEVNEEASVEWTRPSDLEYNPDKPLLGLGSAHPGGFNAGFADGSVRFISNTIDPQLFLRLLMMNDGQPVGQF